MPPLPLRGGGGGGGTCFDNVVSSLVCTQETRSAPPPPPRPPNPLSPLFLLLAPSGQPPCKPGRRAPGLSLKKLAYAKKRAPKILSCPPQSVRRGRGERGIGGGEEEEGGGGRLVRDRRRRRRRRRKVYSGANAVNEEDPERDRNPSVEDLFRRATFLRRLTPIPSGCMNKV